MLILGLSAYYHDSAAALVRDGEIVAAAQEERFSRIKHDARFPGNALRYCLAEGHVQPFDLDYVVFYEKPFLKFDRLFETYMAFAPRGFASFATALPLWLTEKLFQKSMLVRELRRVAPTSSGDWDERLLFSEHHLSHAASAFFPSPFERAAVLTMDGVGEWTTTSVAVGAGNELKVHREVRFPHSLGLLYSAFTYYTGFKVNSGEYKVMGLAPYGEPRYAQRIRDHLIDVREDGSFRLDMQYFNYCTGLTMTSERFHELFDGPPRQSETRLTQRDMDLAASIQVVTEDVVSKLVRNVARETGERDLCLAGGVALNCVANGRLLRERTFDRIWIQPAAGDAGGAVGAALAVCHLMKGQLRRVPCPDGMHGSFLGPHYRQEDIETRLTAAKATFTVLSEDELIDRCARALAEGKALGWHQGRMEFGPRALGGRSILGDPRSPTMQKTLNLKIKYRESFRPFAPSVLAEDVNKWFDLDHDSPYMLLVADVHEEKRMAMSDTERALFGIDRLNYSARIQTVHRETNPRYYALIERFRTLTGCPVLVNTSFNVRGEPIVCTPEDAFRCFMGTQLDMLAVGNCLLDKADQDPSLADRYERSFGLD